MTSFKFLQFLILYHKSNVFLRLFLSHQVQVRIIDDDIPLAQFAVAFSGASWTDPDSIALMVMQSMLGSWNKSAGGGKHMGWVFIILLISNHT